jgi:hypothetical protein
MNSIVRYPDVICVVALRRCGWLSLDFENAHARIFVNGATISLARHSLLRHRACT